MYAVETLCVKVKRLVFPLCSTYFSGTKWEQKKLYPQKEVFYFEFFKKQLCYFISMNIFSGTNFSANGIFE